MPSITGNPSIHVSSPRAGDTQLLDSASVSSVSPIESDEYHEGPWAGGIPLFSLPHDPHVQTNTAANLAQAGNGSNSNPTSPTTHLPLVPPKQSSKVLIKTQHRRKRTDSVSKTHPGPLHAQGLFRWLMTSWGKEILSLATAVVAFLAIIITLQLRNGKPLPEWPLSISINALIAVLNFIFKAAMIFPVGAAMGQLKWMWYDRPHRLQDLDTFDEASKNALGAGKLLFSSKVRHLVSLGALVMLLSIGLDPFTQQVLVFTTENGPLTTGVATMPRSQGYNESIASNATLADAGMLAAIYQGLFNSPSPTAQSHQVKPDCPTGNCTFSTPYRSLSLCHQCFDISDQVTHDNETTLEAATQGGPTYSIPSGLGVNGRFHLMNTTACPTSNLAPNSVKFPESCWPSYEFWKDHSAFVSFSMLSYLQTPGFGHCPINSSRGLVNSNNKTDVPTPFAAYCEIEWCTQTYEASVTNNILNETILSTEISTGILIYNQSNTRTIMPDPCLIDGILMLVDTLLTDPFYANLSRSIVWNGTSNIELPTDCLFWPTGSSLDNLYADIANIFTGSVINKTSYGPSTTRFGRPQVKYMVSPSSDVMSLLFNAACPSLDALNKSIASLTSSLTNYVRSLNNSGPVARGTMFQSQTYIRVQWQWLSPTAVLLVISFYFFVHVVVRSRRESRERIWKSSTLATVFHGLESGASVRGGRALERIEDMESLAKETVVKLTELDGAEQLIAVQTHLQSPVREKATQRSSATKGKRRWKI